MSDNVTQETLDIYAEKWSWGVEDWQEYWKDFGFPKSEQTDDTWRFHDDDLPETECWVQAAVDTYGQRPFVAQCYYRLGEFYNGSEQVRAFAWRPWPKFPQKGA